MKKHIKVSEDLNSTSSPEQDAMHSLEELGRSAEFPENLREAQFNHLATVKNKMIFFTEKELTLNNQLTAERNNKDRAIEAFHNEMKAHSEDMKMKRGEILALNQEKLEQKMDFLTKISKLEEEKGALTSALAELQLTTSMRGQQQVIPISPIGRLSNTNSETSAVMFSPSSS